jgi:superfamily II DNA or RNA helicase
MSFAVGSLVAIRGREWVVLPESDDNLLMVRPLGGTEDEVTGILTSLETIEPATFALPDPSLVGDYRSCKLLRDAVRLGFRSSAGPFRSFGRLAIEPRPYQLVPLLMALKSDPVRILIADDVGIGKTIEACLIAKELIDRGEVEGLSILCPPHLTEQWQSELRDKFNIEAELVLPGTVTRLERGCGFARSLFEIHPFTIVSTDFIKSDRRKDEFLRTAPDLIIVDEAHSCAWGEKSRGGRHQRYNLLKGLSEKENRHIILVTATPHSGKEETFRSLLAFLNKDFKNLPEDLSGKGNEHHRRHLSSYFIQRRRADIRHYLKTETYFPEREEMEQTYKLSEEYKKLFDRVLDYAREIVKDTTDRSHRQRVRWWSILALLRSIGSSPAAASATLRNRAAVANTENIEDADEIGRRTVLDIDLDDGSDVIDLVPGSDTGEETDEYNISRRKLLEMARISDSLYGEKDVKLLKLIPFIKGLLSEGYKPIIFCRFIPTAEYLADELRNRLKGVNVVAVTGKLPPEEREDRIIQLGEEPSRILVATDCLSEGINLQQYFDSVIHYDLSWNPTRHEQREGRVDRYGQPKSKVRVITYYGTDNQIDGIILDVLLRKHKKIKSSLGISVPVPLDTGAIVEAIFEGLLLRGQKNFSADQLLLFDFADPIKEDLTIKWENATKREKLSQTMFAQGIIKPEEVAKELEEIQSAIGSGVDVKNFLKEAILACNGNVKGEESLSFDLTECPPSLIESTGKNKFKAGFELPVDDITIYLNRTHPIVESVASYIMNTSLDPYLPSVARRCGVIRTGKVERRTTVLLLRLRFHIITIKDKIEKPLLAEDSQLIAFTGSPQNAVWLKPAIAEELLLAKPEENINPDQAEDFIKRVTENIEFLNPHIEEVARNRADELLLSHRRVRLASRHMGVSYRVEPQLPPDILGIYIYLPVEV